MHTPTLNFIICIMLVANVGSVELDLPRLHEADGHELACDDVGAQLTADVAPLDTADGAQGSFPLVVLLGAGAVATCSAMACFAFNRAVSRSRAAAICIQAGMRGCHARRVGQYVHACARLIQSAWRYHVATVVLPSALLVQAAARGWLTRRVALGPTAELRATLARWRAWRRIMRHATVIQAAARGFLARMHMSRASTLASSSGASATKLYPAAQAADRPTMAPGDGHSATSRRHRKRSGKKGAGDKQAAEGGVPQWPQALPGVINFRTPRTWCHSGDKIVIMLFPHMKPMADFSEAKCDVLRRIIVTRIERIDDATWSHARLTLPPCLVGLQGPPRTPHAPTLMAWILRALLAEDVARRMDARSNPAANRERYPGGHSTALVRFLGDYLKCVEDAEALVAPRDNVYKNFSRVINQGRTEFRSALIVADVTDDSDDELELDAVLQSLIRHKNRHGVYPPAITLLTPHELARLDDIARIDGESSGDDDELDTKEGPSTAGKTVYHSADEGSSAGDAACGTAAGAP